MGVKGLIKDKETGDGIKKAVIEIEGIDKKVYSTDRGEYWRLLMPNNNKTYKMTVSADGYKTSDKFDIAIKDGTKIRRFDVNLSPVDKVDIVPQKPIGEQVKDVEGEEKKFTKHFAL